MAKAPRLSKQHREAILRLGRPRGWGSEIEPEVLCELTAIGLVEVNSKRLTVLTKEGRQLYSEMVTAKD